MTLVERLVLLRVAGALGEAIAGCSHGGCFVSIAVGFIGAPLGSWIARAMGLPEIFMISVGGHPFPVIWAIIGTAPLVRVLGFLRRGTGPRVG